MSFRRIGMVACALVVSGALAQTGPPRFERERVQYGGSSRTAPLAPGLLFSIYGENLGPTAGCQGQADSKRLEDPSPPRPVQSFVERLSYPRELCGVRVLIGEMPAELLYVQSQQINFKVPQKAPVEGSAEMRVVFNGQSSRPVTMPFGIEKVMLSLDRPAAVGMPVWLRMRMPYEIEPRIQYPNGVHPADFGCGEIEVRRDGKLLQQIATMASQAFNGLTIAGFPCGSLALPSHSQHAGRIPLHLQYRFDQPGIYEVRYTFRNPVARPGGAPPEQSEWTRIEIQPATPVQRAQWLAERSRNVPSDAVELLTDFLPGILGIPDDQSFAILRDALYHPDPLVRQYAMYGLTYWPAAQARERVWELMRTRGPSDVEVTFLATTGRDSEIVTASIPYLQSDSPVLQRGAVTAVMRLPMNERAERALIDAANHIEQAADPQTVADFAAALGKAKNDRASTVLWDMIGRRIAYSQAVIALTWRKSAADLPKLGQLALGQASSESLRSHDLYGLPGALHRAYGDAALPYLTAMMERSEFPWVRTEAARELFPELRSKNDPAVLEFLKARAK